MTSQSSSHIHSLLQVRLHWNLVVNTSYQKLPFGSGDYPDKLWNLVFFAGILLYEPVDLVASSVYVPRRRPR